MPVTTLTPDRLKAPQGRLDRRVLWPRVKEVDVDDKLAAYLTDADLRGATITDQDDLDSFAESWAYWRAYDDVHQRMLVNPSTYGLGGQGNASWLLTQIQDVERKANEARAEAEEILGLYLVTVEEALPVTKDSACVPVTYVP